MAEQTNRGKTVGGGDVTADFVMNDGEIPFSDGSPATPAPSRNDAATQATESAEPALGATKVDPNAPTKPTGTTANKATVLGDYKLLKKLGQGGMGVVYKALHQSLERDVAIKVLSKELGNKQTFVQRFHREAKVMAKLDHPNILRCFDAGTTSGLHYLVVEFVEGGSVENWLQKLKKFEIGDAFRITLDCLSALDHAHQQNLIHRDIKPDNILLTKAGIVKVADLGLAKAVDDDLSLTKTGTGAGTPIYMAPEQARDAKHVDQRCDLYAVGIMLYVFLTGETPFKGETLVDLITAKEKGKFKPIRHYNSDVPERVDLIVDKMLAVDPKHRFESCAEVYAELDGLALAYESLSFFGTPQAGVSANRTMNLRVPAATPQKTKGPASAASQTAAPRPAVTQTESEPEEAGIWFWKFSKDGKAVIKKLKTAELLLLVKTGRIDDTATLSKTLKGLYRALGTYPEFASRFKGKVADEKTGHTVDHYKSKMADIDRQDRRQRFWKSFRGFFGKVTGTVGLVIWLAILAALGVGGYFGVMWALKHFEILP